MVHKIISRMTPMWALFLLVLFSFPNRAFAGWDITVEIVDLVVTDDGADTFSDPDVYVNFWVKRPQRGHHGIALVGTHNTPTLSGQGEGSHPHKGYTFTAVHYDPLQVEFTVYDEDWPDFDDIMAIGILPIGLGGPYTKTVVGPYATITVKVTVKPSNCGGDITYVSRSFGDSGYDPVTVDLMLHVQEDEPTEVLTLREYLPFSAVFLGAEPMPDAIEIWTIDDDPDLFGQVLVWNLVNPPGGEHF